MGASEWARLRNTFGPVSRIQFIRVALATAAGKGWKAWLDIRVAFFSAGVEEEEEVWIKVVTG